MNKGRAKEIKQVLRPHRGPIAAILAIQAVAVFAQVESIRLLKPILDSGAFDNDIEAVLSLGVYLLVLTVMTLVCLTVVSVIASRVATAVASELRIAIITAALRSDRMDSMGDSTTKAMTSLTSDVNTFQNFLYETLRTYVPMPLLMLVLFYLTFEINPVVGLMVTVVFSIITAVTLSFGQRVYRLYPQQVERTDRVNNRLREKVAGYRAIRTFCAGEYESAKFAEASAELGKVNRTVMTNSYFIPNLTTAMIWVSIITIYMIASLDAYGQTVNPTNLLLFMQYTTYIVATLALIPYLSTEAPRAVNCFRRIQKMVASADTGSESREPPFREDADPLRFEDVNVTDGRGRHTVRGVSLTLRKGETLTVVGPNGCGASDLVGTALGYSVPDSGKVYVFGAEIDEHCTAAVRRRTVYVGSMLGIMRGTLRFNLDPHGKRTDREILDMCARCGLDRLVDALPGGLDTRMDVNDNGLSGGQRQLVSLVRGLLRDADIYIFDNCFFSLDSATRDAVNGTLRAVCSGRTVLFCMHDLSTCGISDRVVVMEGGRLTGTVENGTAAGDSPFLGSAATASRGGDVQWV